MKLTTRGWAVLSTLAFSLGVWFPYVVVGR